MTAVIQTSKEEDITHQLCLRRRPATAQVDLPSHCFTMDSYFMCPCECKTIYLLLSHFVLFSHCCLCISPSLFLFFPCSVFGVFHTSGSLQDMVTKYQKRKNKT